MKTAENRTSEDQELLDAITIRKEELQDVKTTDAHSELIYEYNLKCSIAPPFLSEERLISTTEVPIEELTECMKKTSTTKVKVKTLNGGIVGENQDKISDQTYIMTVDELVDFIRGTTSVAEEFYSFEMIQE